MIIVRFGHSPTRKTDMLPWVPREYAFAHHVGTIYINYAVKCKYNIKTKWWNQFSIHILQLCQTPYNTSTIVTHHNML